MKKLFAIIAAVLFAGSMMAEGLLFEQTYPGEPSTKAGSYSKSFTLTTNGYTLTYSHINNGTNSDSWDAVRAGSKNKADTATITSAAITDKVSRIVIDFTQVLADKTSALYLQVADNADFTSATKINADIAVGEVEFEVASPAANMFYQVVIEMKQGSANGFNRWDKIQFISPDGGTPIVPTVYDTLTVAQAKAIADTLADNGTSKTKYYVEGYAVHVDPYSDTYHNQIFFMVDDFAAPDSTFEAYAAYPSKDGQVYQVLAGDKVRAFGAFKKYVQDGKSQLELVNPTVEFLEEVEGDRTIKGPDTITTAQALEIAKALAEPASNSSSTNSSKEYVVGGYAVQVWARNTDKTWSFGMADVENDRWEFQASNASIKDGNDTVVKNDYMYVRGFIAKRKTSSGSLQYQIYKGTAIHGEPIAIEMDTIGAVEAYNRAKALPVDGSELVCVEAYVAQIKTAYSSEHGNITVWLNDDPSSTYGNIQAYRAACSAEDGAAIVEHCRVRVVGNIVHTTYEQDGATKDSYQIAQGAKLTLLNGAGIEETIVLDKAVKMIENGQLIIEKNGVKYNAQGAVVK